MAQRRKVIMIWFLYIGGPIVGFILLTYLVGLGLSSTHTARVRIRLDRSPGEIWKVIHDFEKWPEWYSFVKSMKRREDGIWIMDSKMGTVPQKVLTSEEPKKIVTEIADPKMSFGGTWTWEIDPDGSVTITENGIIRNPSLRFASRFMFGYTSGPVGFLKALGKKLGVEAVPEVLQKR